MQMSNKQPNNQPIRTFHRDGMKVILKTVIPPVEFSTKEILNAINSEEAQKQKQESQIEQVKEQIPKMEENIKNIDGNLKKLNKFKDWATDFQVSRLRVLVDEVKEEVEKRVRDEYEIDDTMTEKDNKIQMFCQLKGYIQRHPKISEEIISTIFMAETSKNGYVENPF